MFRIQNATTLKAESFERHYGTGTLGDSRGAAVHLNASNRKIPKTYIAIASNNSVNWILLLVFIIDRIVAKEDHAKHNFVLKTLLASVLSCLLVIDED